MSHAHHWRIGEADGPTSDGQCLTCGATREFQNSIDFGAMDPGDRMHRLFAKDFREVDGAWISDRQRENWQW